MNKDQEPEDSSPNPEPETPAAETAPVEATPPPAPEADSTLSPDSKNMGMLCHLLALSGFLIPFGNIIGPLVIWLMKKESDPYVDKQGKESLNFQISVAIYIFVSGLLIFVVIGIFLIPVLAIAALVLTIIGTIKASKGEPWQYPATIRFLK